MTNEIESLTNVVSVVTQSHITPQTVAYDFKQWAGVVAMIYASLSTIVTHAFPVIQRFLDTRQGGCIKWLFGWVFGKPLSASPQTGAGEKASSPVAPVVQPGTGEQKQN